MLHVVRAIQHGSKHHMSRPRMRQTDQFPALRLAAVSMQSGAPQVCVETMMHLTCTNMPQEKLEDALTKVTACL